MEQKRVLPIFLIITFVFYLFLSFSYEVVVWDAASFFNNARVFSYGEGFFEWSRAPFWSFILALYPIEIFGKIISPVFGVLGVLAIYLLGKEFFGERAGLLSAFLLAINPIYAFWSVSIVADVASFTFMTFAVLFFLKSFNNPRWFYLFGLFMGISFLLRYATILVIVPLFLYLLHKRFELLKKKEFWISIMIFFALLTPWIMFNHVHTGDAFTSFSRGTETIFKYDVYSKPVYYYIINLHNIYSAFVAFFIVAILLSKDRRKFAFPLALFLVFIIFLSFASYKFPRHMILSFAGVAIISGYGFTQVLKLRKYLYACIIISILFLVFPYIGENPFQYEPQEIKQVGMWAAKELPEDSLAMSPYWVHLNYYGQKSYRWFLKEWDSERSGIYNFQEFVNGYRIRYAIVPDEALWPAHVNTEYVTGLEDFKLIKRIGNFTVFEYTGNFSGYEIEPPLELIFI